MLPKFISIGPQRTATTWLYECLKSHVIFPKGVKETQFFDKHYSKGIKWYAEHFPPGDASPLAGEIAPTYFHSDEAPERIKTHLGGIKIICSLRDPVQRLYSLYKLMLEYGMTHSSFEDALKNHPFMLDSSRYAYHVERWIELFGRERVLVLFYEDLQSSPENYLTKVCDFLELPNIELPAHMRGAPDKEAPARNLMLASCGQKIADFLRSHRCYRIINGAKALGLKSIFFGGGQPLPGLLNSTETALREQFQDDINMLERLLKRDLSAWKPHNHSLATS